MTGEIKARSQCSIIPDIQKPQKTNRASTVVTSPEKWDARIRLVLCLVDIGETSMMNVVQTLLHCFPAIEREELQSVTLAEISRQAD